MRDCSRCGERMSHNDETTKLTEYVCPHCHATTIVRKTAYRVTPDPTAPDSPAADD